MLRHFPRSSEARRRSGRRAFAWAAILVVALAATNAAAAEPDRTDELAQLRAEMARMRAEYETRIARLDARLRVLEGRPAPVGQVDTRQDELDDLRAAAREAAGSGGATEREPSPAVPVQGHERNLNRLNPEISFTGDILAGHEDSANDFDAREFELDLQSALDPFSSTKWTLAFGDGEVEIEEGYIDYHGLRGGLSVRAGKMRQTFGALNRHHLHALPQVDYPVVYASFFGDEGLVQTGLSLEWLVPRPWASANELTLQITDGSADPFGGDSFDRLATLLHLKNYWDLSTSTYFEWGLSGISGSPEDGRETRVLGTDFTVHWQPPSRAKYRELTWRTELLRSDRDDEFGIRREAWGGYTYLEGLVRRNLSAGLRFDRYEDPLDPGNTFRAFEPYVSWWQSEFVRLRLAYRARTDELLDETEHDIRVQLTWSAGPHKHESY